MKKGIKNFFVKLNLFGKKIALIYEENTITYDEVVANISFYENYLKKIGVKQGDIVGIMFPNSPEFVYSLFSIWKTGAIAVPINILLKKKEVEYIIKHSGMKTVISGESFFSEMAGECVMVKKVDNTAFFDTTSLTKLQKIQDNDREILDNDVAIIIYTSGTTDNPKGVKLTFDNLFSNITSWFKSLDHGPKDTVLLVLPLFHIFGLTLTLLTTLYTGGKGVILSKFNPEKVIELINKYKVTILPGVPTMFIHLQNLPGINAEKLKSLRFCISGGAPLSREALLFFEEKFNVPILEGYGLSEASPLVAINPYKMRKINSVGLPVSAVEVKIVDENGLEVKTNGIGEIVIRGKNIMKGYYRMQEITAKTLKDGWLHTGDLGKKDEDGYLFIVDRKKDLIITGGYNVYPNEVEKTLLEKPEILEAAVIGVPDKIKGEIIKSFIVFKDGMKCSEEDIIEYCKGEIAAFKCPKIVSILPSLPKNATGKILKNALKAQ